MPMRTLQRPVLGIISLAVLFAGASLVPDDAEAARKARPAKAKKAKPAPYGGGPRATIYMNAETGEILGQHDPDKTIEPASLTKEVTAMVVFDALRSGKLKPGTTLPLASVPALEGAGAVTLRKSALRKKAPIPAGTPLTVDTLLSATAVLSAADATVTLARGICGNEQCFTDMMNDKVRDILKVPAGQKSSTVFANSHGMPGNRSTARDLAEIHRYMISTYPKEARYFAKTDFSVRGVTYSGHNALLVDYECRNSLNLAYRCLEASKTGFFRAAGFGIVGSAAWNGYRVIGVEMGYTSAGARNQKLREGLDSALKKLDASGAPKTATQPWHFPSIGPRPNVDPEPGPEEDSEEEDLPAMTRNRAAPGVPGP